MERENERKGWSLPSSEFATSSQNSLAGESSGQRQTVGRVDLGPEVAAILIRILPGSTSGHPEILGNQVLPNKTVLRRTNSYFWTDTISGNYLTLTATAASH